MKRKDERATGSMKKNSYLNEGSGLLPLVRDIIKRKSSREREGKEKLGSQANFYGQGI